MRSFGQVPETALAPPPAAPLAITPMPGAKEIPYDYVARFQLLGKRGERVQDVINVSVEGAFVAAAIGYSFLPPRLDTPAVTRLTNTFNTIHGAIRDVWLSLGGWPIRRKKFIVVSLFACAASTSNTASSRQRERPRAAKSTHPQHRGVGRGGRQSAVPALCQADAVPAALDDPHRGGGDLEGSLYGDQAGSEAMAPSFHRSARLQDPGYAGA